MPPNNFARSNMPRAGAPPGMKEDILERDHGQSENGRLSYEHEREPEAVSRYPFAPPVVALFIAGVVGPMWGVSGLLMKGLSYGTDSSLNHGVSYGLVGILLSVLTSGKARSIEPAEILVWSWKRLQASIMARTHTRNACLIGLASALIIGLSYWLRYWLMQKPVEALSTALSYGLGDGLALAGSYWLLLGLLQSASRESFQEHQRVVPNQGISRSLHNGLLLGLLSGVVWVIIGAIAILTSDVLGYVLRDGVRQGLHYGLSKGLTNGLRVALTTLLSAGPMLGLVGGLGVFLLSGGFAWWQHWVLRILLWRSGVLPLQLVRFLDEATEGSFLRRVGGGYHFVHDLFRDYLASLDTSKERGKLAPKTSEQEK